VTRFEAQLRSVDPGVAELLQRLPRRDQPPLPPEWLRSEMLERFRVVQEARLEPGSRILEVGSGPDALSTVPLAYRAGPDGRVVALERARWSRFREVVRASGLADRVAPVAADAVRLPFRDDSFELAACVHGIRSLEAGAIMERVLGEMLRVARRMFVAESLPLARTEAQKAHLAMYDLRHQVFEAVNGRPDDLPYLPLERVAQLVRNAGGVVERTEVIEVDLPHFLAYLPRELIDRVPDPGKRDDLLRRWREAKELGDRYGTDHPPVGVVLASRRGAGRS
jgi:SAM-dependent methyltransferase